MIRRDKVRGDEPVADVVEELPDGSLRPTPPSHDPELDALLAEELESPTPRGRDSIDPR